MITTNSGSIRGIIQSSSLSGRTVQKFPNIPYAEAPVGQLRFEKPQPKKPWKGKVSVYDDLTFATGEIMYFTVCDFARSSIQLNIYELLQFCPTPLFSFDQKMEKTFV